eukprot:scaffold254649_cov43-Tisochrysis_lutea.AAC.1
MKALADAVSKGALNNLSNLDLHYNIIGDKGKQSRISQSPWEIVVKTSDGQERVVPVTRLYAE